MTKAKRTSKSSTKPAELPEWLTQTPSETEYQLAMWEGGSDGVQIIELCRVEYMALKAHLAKMRGYVVPKAA